MNQVMMIGRLTRDPEVRWTGDNFAVAKFSIAVDRERKNRNGEKETDFPNCVAFGKTAEFVEKYIGKGRLVAIVGRMESSKYERDGQTVVRWEVACNSVEPLDKKQTREPSGVEWNEEDFKF